MSSSKVSDDADVAGLKTWTKPFPKWVRRDAEEYSVNEQENGLTVETVEEFFENYEKIVQTYNIPPEMIWNGGETRLEGTRGKRIATRKLDLDPTITRTEPQTKVPISLFLTISAKGNSCKPLATFPVETVPPLPQDITSYFHISGSHSGAMTPLIMETLIFCVFTKELNEFRKKYLMEDSYALLILSSRGLASSLNEEELFQKYGIIILFLPSHSSGLLQPLNVGPWKHLRERYYELQELGMSNVLNSDISVDELRIHSMWNLQRALSTALSGDVILTGWETSGMYPISSAVALKSKKVEVVKGPPFAIIGTKRSQMKEDEKIVEEEEEASPSSKRQRVDSNSASNHDHASEDIITQDHVESSVSSHYTKPPSPFITFFSWKRPEVYAAMPHAKGPDLAKIMSLMWHCLSAKEKAEYSFSRKGVHCYTDEEEQIIKEKMKEFNNFETEYCLSLVHDLISLEHKTPSPFMKFCSWKRHDVYKKLPNVTFTDTSKILGLMWNNLSADEKAEYEYSRKDAPIYSKEEEQIIKEKMKEISKLESEQILIALGIGIQEKRNEQRIDLDK